MDSEVRVVRPSAQEIQQARLELIDIANTQHTHTQTLKDSPEPKVLGAFH